MTTTALAAHAIPCGVRERMEERAMSRTVLSLVCLGWALIPSTLLAADFTTRCAAPGVIRCVGFDNAVDLVGDWGDNHGSDPGTNPASSPELDTTIKSSGASSMKFTIASQSGSGGAGSWFTNFSNDLSVQFGENSTFYVQWRQRFSPEFINTVYLGNGGGPAGGWKQAIIGTGDQLWCDGGTNVNAPCTTAADCPGGSCAACESVGGDPRACATSCSALEVPTQNTNQRKLPQMYNSCTGSTSHGPYDPFNENFGAYDFKLQNARPSPYCLYSQGQTNPPSYFPPNGACFGYSPNEWMTFQVQIQTGPRANDEFTNSYVRLWVSRDGQASEAVLNWGPYNLTAGPPARNYKFGKVHLLPYHTEKSATQSHPTAYTWYDELIISRNKIADPDGAPAGTPPAAPSNVRVQ